MSQDTQLNSYEFHIKILGNEIFSIGFTSSDGSNRWILIGILSTFSVLTVLGAYGEKLANFYHFLIN